MRQIEDRWRPNLRDLPNESETYKNIVDNFVMNESQKNDVRNYSLNALKNYINGTCSKVCLNSSNVDYKTCLENCSFKLLESDKILIQQNDAFEAKLQRLGKNIFY